MFDLQDRNKGQTTVMGTEFGWHDFGESKVIICGIHSLKCPSLE